MYLPFQKYAKEQSYHQANGTKNDVGQDECAYVESKRSMPEATPSRTSSGRHRKY
jgi:hypothetical protein